MALELTAYAAYDTDWHVFIDDPDQGPLGYCTGTGPDEGFAPEAATRALRDGGWTVTGEWTPAPPDADGQYIALVVPIP